MTVSIQFLWLSRGVLVILLPLTVYMATSGLRDRQVHLWCAGSLAMGMGFVLVSLRAHVSPWLTFNISQLLIICGYVIRTYSLRIDEIHTQEQGKKIIRRYALILGVYYLAFSSMVYAQAEERIRLILVYAFQVYLAIDLYRVSRRSYKSIPISGTTLISYMAILLLITTFFKVCMLIVGVGSVGVFQMHIDQYVSFASYFLSYIFGNFGFVQLKMYKAHTSIEATLQKNIELEKQIEEKNNLLRNLSLSAKSNVLGTMMASIAHELNQPLTAIQLNMQMIRRFASQNTESYPEKAIGSITDSVARCAGIIKSLRSFFTKDSMLMLRINLAELIREIVSIASVDAKSRNITIDCDLKEGIFIQGEKHQLQTVFFNLIHNAFEAMNVSTGQRRITLTIFRTENHAICEITDTGQGIDPSQIDNIFDLYSSSKPEGMGIGLWLTKSIMESHDATIIADSNQQGGAKFVLTFKAAPSIDDRAGQSIVKSALAR